MKIRTTEEFEAFLTKDLKWRSQEMFEWEKTARTKKGLGRSAILRGGWSMVYAHWEGYVKSAGTAYVDLVSRRGLALSQLRDELVAVALRPEIEKLAIQKSPEAHTRLIQIIRSDGAILDDCLSALKSDISIRTHSNLNFERFASIMHSLGCDSTRYASDRNMIDERLLARRNSIAHGEILDVDMVELFDASQRIYSILKDVRTQLSNSIATQGYMVSTV